MPDQVNGEIGDRVFSLIEQNNLRHASILISRVTDKPARLRLLYDALAFDAVRHSYEKHGTIKIYQDPREYELAKAGKVDGVSPHAVLFEENGTVCGFGNLFTYIPPDNPLKIMFENEINLSN
jgi:hypothetical protein